MVPRHTEVGREAVVGTVAVGRAGNNILATEARADVFDVNGRTCDDLRIARARRVGLDIFPRSTIGDGFGKIVGEALGA